MAIFVDVQYCIYADKVGGWGPKRLKICWRIIGMAPNVAVCCTKVPNKCIGQCSNITIIYHPVKYGIWAAFSVFKKSYRSGSEYSKRWTSMKEDRICEFLEIIIF